MLLTFNKFGFWFGDVFFTRKIANAFIVQLVLSISVPFVLVRNLHHISFKFVICSVQKSVMITPGLTGVTRATWWSSFLSPCLFLTFGTTFLLNRYLL